MQNVKFDQLKLLAVWTLGIYLFNQMRTSHRR